MADKPWLIHEEPSFGAGGSGLPQHQQDQSPVWPGEVEMRELESLVSSHFPDVCNSAHWGREEKGEERKSKIGIGREDF